MSNGGALNGEIEQRKVGEEMNDKGNGNIWCSLSTIQNSVKFKYWIQFQSMRTNASIYFELSRYYRKFKDIKTYDDV